MKNTKKEALGILNKLDNDLISITKKLDSLEVSQLEKRLSPESWSVLEVMEHLNIAEQLSYSYLKYKTDQDAKFEKAGLYNAIRGWMLVQFFNLPVKVKAPNVNGLNPINKSLDYATIKREWLITRNNLASLCEKLDDSDFKLAMYKHPSAGRITLSYMLKFFDIHVQRHLKQINNILNG